MTNANSKLHSINVWGIYGQCTPEQQKVLDQWDNQSDNEGHSINDMIRIVRTLIKWGHSRTKVDVSITTETTIITQWNDGLELSTQYSDQLSTLLADLLLLRKWFNAPRPKNVR